MSNILHLRLNTIEDGQVWDISGSNNHGTVSGATVVENATFGAAMYFDGIDNSIDLGNPASLLISDTQTIAMWLRPSALGSTGRLFTRTTNSNDGIQEDTLTHDADGLLTYVDSQSAVTMRSGRWLSPDHWTHVAIVRNISDETISLYFNGTLEVEAQATSLPVTGSEFTTFLIGTGGDSTDSSYHGYMTNIRVYDSALTQSAIEAIMTQDKQADSAVSRFRNTHPIDFALYDSEAQSVLYIDDNSSQELTVQITNAASTRITLDDLTYGDVSATNYHFALRFRPGTLSAFSLTAMALTAASTADWQASSPTTDENGMDIIYVKSTASDATIDSARSVTFVFQNVGADAGQGSRGTRVQLRCDNMRYAGSDDVLQTKRQVYLNIVNHSGIKDLPLYVGFVGDDAILNDGSTANTLALRFTNILVYDETNPTKSELYFKYDTDQASRSKIILTFDAGDVTDSWALSTEEKIDDIQISNPVGWTHDYSADGKNAQWVLYPNGTDQTLVSREAPDGSGTDHFDVTISNIVTDFPTGYTCLHIAYENIPGYWDSQITVAIEKQPLVLKNKNVGINTANPQIDLAIGDDDTGLQQQGDNELAIFTDNTERVRIDSSGHVGIGTTSPEKLLHIQSSDTDTTAELYIRPGDWGNGSYARILLGATGNHYIEGKNNGGMTFYDAKCFAFEGSNIGIGTTSPTEALDVNGNVNVSGNINASGNIDISGDVNISNDTVMNGYLTVSDGANFGGDVEFAGNEAAFSGKVGIGIASPSVPLHIDGGSGVSLSDNDSGYFIIGPADAGHMAFDKNDIMVKNNGVAKDLYIQREGGTTNFGGDVKINNNKPFFIKKYSNKQDFFDTGYDTSNYIACIAGFQSGQGDINENNSGVIMQMYPYEDSGTWHIGCDFRSHNTNEDWTVWVLFISTAIADNDI